MDLEVYSSSLELLGVLDNFNVLKWHRKYYKSGVFELTCSLTPNNLELLKKENIIYKSDGEAGIIYYRNIKLSRDGEEVLYIKGNFLTGILDRRINWKQLLFNGKSEVLMRNMVNDNCINPSNYSRKIPFLKLGQLKGYIEKIDYQNSYGNLINELENIANTNELGYRVNLNYETLELEFEVYKGIDRTDNQSVNSKAIFSRQYENVLEQDYIESIYDYKNTALVAGEGEGSQRILVAINDSIKGLERYELFVDARDLQKEINDVILTDVEYKNTLTQRGKEKLAEYKDVRAFDSVINVNQENLVYKKDYDLGDIVTVFDESWNITIDTRITEIQEIYQNNNLDINIIFGNDVPSVYNKIKRMVK